MRAAFVESVLQKLLGDGTIKRSDSIVTVCAGTAERDLFQTLDFSRVLITNLDERMRAEQFVPFEWSRQDAQRLSFPDGSFDVAFVADGLHHCRSPHRALLEMYRVVRRVVVVIESRDNIIMRLANRLGLSPKYELESVIDHDFAYEGVDNTPIPNFIYRWTEAEFRKVLQSYNPVGRHSFKFFYSLNLPYQLAELKKSPLKLWAVYVATPMMKAFTLLLKRQCNSFAMVATKPVLPADLWPWLKQGDEQIEFNRAYATKRFKT